jgi:hypothetical protein
MKAPSPKSHSLLDRLLLGPWGFSGAWRLVGAPISNRLNRPESPAVPIVAATKAGCKPALRLEFLP